MSGSRMRAGIGALVLAFTALMCVSLAGAEPAVPTGAENQAAMVAARDRVTLTRPVTPAFEASEAFTDFVDKDSGDEFWIEDLTGQIRRYKNREAIVVAEERPVSEVEDLGADVIETLAHGYLTRVIDESRLANGRLSVERMDHGSEISYLILWTEYVGEVRTFNNVCLCLSPDGLLLTMDRLDCQIDEGVDLSPSITRGEAVETVASNFKLERWATEDAELALVRDLDGAQRLCWLVTLETGTESFGAGFFGAIDAATGDLLDQATTS